MRDWAESGANALVGLAVSAALVEALRAAGWWDAPSLVLSMWFLAASLLRGYALRRAFRWMEARG